MKMKKDQLLNNSMQKNGDNIATESDASKQTNNCTTERIQEIRKMFFKVSYKRGIEDAVAFLNTFAEVYSLADYHIEAIAAWEGSIQWHPYQIKAYIDLAREYVKVGDDENAGKTLKKVVELMPPGNQASVISSCLAPISGDDILASIELGAHGFSFSGANPSEFWRYRKEDANMEEFSCLSESSMGQIVEMLSATGGFRELKMYQRIGQGKE